MKRIMIVSIIVIMCLTACSAQQDIQPTVVSRPVKEAVQTESQPAESYAETISQTPADIGPVYKENDAVYHCYLGDRARSFDTLDELNEISDFVITGECISSTPVFQDRFLYTVSDVKIETVYRGGSLAAGDTVKVIETGGRTTYGEYDKNVPKENKAFDTGDPMPSDYRFIQGIDGHFPL